MAAVAYPAESDFSDVNPSLKLANIEMFYLGFGDRGGSTFGTDGSAYIDSIRLYPRTCVLTERPSEFAKLDLNDDCIISFGDVEIMAEDWLEADVNLGAITQPSDANLVGWWEFDEGNGNLVTDSSGNDHNGVIETNDVDVWWVAGRGDVNYALDFDGGIVRVPDACELRPTRKLTVCAWIQYFEKQNKGSRIVNKGMNDKETFVLQVDEEDRGSFYVRDANKPDENDYDVNSIDRLDRGDWIHLAGTYDNNSVKFYLNGELKDTLDEPNAWGITLSQDTNDMEIGNSLLDPEDDKSFRGLIDEVRLYDRALSAEEIAWLASDGIGTVSVQSIANLVNDEDLGERAVNFRDFAILADDWLKQELYP
ncbi:MAG: LamG domain-containing protein [Planctomycetota bacterium]